MDDRPTREIHTSRPGGRFRDGKVPWFPYYLLLETGAALLGLALLSLVALLVDAPLLDLADPQVTPDPSKAPWYFVGLQELLHYYPTVVAGALVPAATVVLLAFTPFAARTPLWPEGEPRQRRLGALLAGLGIVLAAAVVPAQHVPWLVVVPTASVGAAMLAPGVLDSAPTRRLGRISLVAWIAWWLGLCAVVLTVAGALFRGPGWAWALPWSGGGL